MGNHTKLHDQPPLPGGDPDQPNDDVPDSPAAKEKDQGKGKDKSGYGHIGNNEVPRPENAPAPHQIF
ncbi:MAG: hypothetical protein M3O26_20180 [Pseudomonadota bacterium]|nr:hypothetical protein [Pseudomonadota bacterium]